MIRITAICGCGIGTSVFAKTLINESCDELGYDTSDLNVNTDEIGATRGVTSEIVVTSAALYDRVSELLQDKSYVNIISVENICSGKDELKEKIAPLFAKYAEEGRLGKKSDDVNKKKEKEEKKEKKKGFLFFK